jgi:hypothetical protein
MSEEKIESGFAAVMPAGMVAGVDLGTSAEPVTKAKRVRRTKAQIAEAEARGEIVRRGAKKETSATLTYMDEAPQQIAPIASQRGIGARPRFAISFTLWAFCIGAQYVHHTIQIFLPFVRIEVRR